VPLTDGHQRFPQENNVNKNVDERYSVNMALALEAGNCDSYRATVIVNPCESDSSRFKWNHSLPLHIKHESYCMSTKLLHTSLLELALSMGIKDEKITRFHV